MSIDIKKNFWGKKQIFNYQQAKNLKYLPCQYAKQIEKAGAGEILLNSVDQDGVMQGYDLDLIAEIANYVDIPMIACGGASKLDDFAAALKAGADAVAAGSLFVFKGRQRGVLINYPSQEQLEQLLGPI